MKVSDLIELLMKCDLDAEVTLPTYRYNGGGDEYKEYNPSVVSTDFGVVYIVASQDVDGILYNDKPHAVVVG